MHKIIGAAALLALLGATASSAGVAVAGTDPSSGRETFVMTFQSFNDIDQPTRVAATGPVQGSGTETQTDQDIPGGEAVTFTWHFAGGTVSGEAVESYSFAPDLTSCTAKSASTGTWRITGGTGAYAGAAGSGTFTSRGSFTGARDPNGACDPAAAPKTSVSTVRGAGTAAVPAP